MVSRAVLMIRLGLSKYCDFAIEHPDRSLLGSHPRMRALKKAHPDKCMQVRTYMGNFNGPTHKGTLLWGASWLRALGTSKPKMVARKQLVKVSICKRTGKKQMTGSKDLKSSQEYTPDFGRAVASAYSDHRKALFRYHDPELDVDTDADDDGEEWADAMPKQYPDN